MRIRVFFATLGVVISVAAALAAPSPTKWEVTHQLVYSMAAPTEKMGEACSSSRRSAWDHVDATEALGFDE